MRAQLAMLESVICIVLLGSAFFTLLDSLSHSPIPEPSQYAYAVFSIMSAYESNSSMRYCINTGTYSAICNDILSDVIEVYGVPGIGITHNNNAMYFGTTACKYSKTYCSISTSNGISYVCIRLCGG
ncbi:MAG: hypothetical protein M1465_02115 [Candidatus Marsarchaeota archaeon]|nr:hypothetical protein [Candidatus Marsarchaeota archaeon]